MMSSSQTVTVYHFRVYEPDAEGFHVSTFKASRALIVDRFRGDVLEGTDEEVECSALDAEGRYRRIATGWGELS